MFLGKIFFVLGLVFGSFLNSLVYRIESENDLSGRSFCPECRKTIRWYDNLPVLSYVILKGRCRNCEKKISIRYPLIELLVGFVFLIAFCGSEAGRSLSWWFGEVLVDSEAIVGSGFPAGDFAALLVLLVIFFILILVALYDATTKYVLSYYVYAAALLSVGYNLFQFDREWGFVNLYEFFLPFVLSALIPAFLFWLIVKLSRERAMGLGDIEIAVLVGLFLGWPLVLVSYYFAFVVGAAWGVFLIFRKKAGLKSEVPFGPFLIAGVFFAFLFGEQIIRWYDRIFLGL